VSASNEDLSTSRACAGQQPLPELSDQREFWNKWNREWRFRERDPFMQRQCEVALEVAKAAGLDSARILDVGCGTGWLGNSLAQFGEVTGTDLSAAAIEEGRRRHPGVKLVSGDFLTVDLQGPFDFVVSADALAHFYDREAFFRRVAALTRPGGTFLLMTQNRFVWERRSKMARVEHGQIQRWSSLRELRRLLAVGFTIQRESSIVPGGDRGLIWWVENRYVRGILGRTIGWQRWDSMLEAAKLGRELVIVAKRR
jgi:SAM-dependent methyltransferase